MNAGEVARETRPVATSFETFTTGHYSWHRGRALYTRFLADRVTETSRGPVLDVGCGMGHFLAAMRDRKIGVVGFDISPIAVDGARRNASAEVLHHDALRPWPFEDESFDAVTMFDVLEHFSFERFILEEARRVLSHRGSLFLVTVNRNSILHTIMGEGWGAKKDPEHVTYYNREELSRAVQNAGFSVETNRTFFNLGVAGEASRVLRPLRVPGILIFARAIGDSIYLRAIKG